jgi:hypothetical protein
MTELEEPEMEVDENRRGVEVGGTQARQQGTMSRTKSAIRRIVMGYLILIRGFRVNVDVG